MILTVEVYPRDVSIDSHAESSYASFPQTIDVNDRYYKSIKTIIISQSEGGQPINKLIIGTSSLNILVTSTFKLTPRCNEMSTAGPAAPSVLNGNDLSNAQILFRKVNAEEYINETTSTKFDIALCRQLTSGIDDESTYLPYRCNLFDSLTLQPITIFTLHKLPLIGFSLSKTNSSRKTSMFFSAIAKCIVKKNGNFEMKKLDKLIKVNIKNQDLDPILASLEEKMKDSKEGGICIIDFLSQQKGLSKLAQSLSGPINTANKKIQTNITTFLSDYFKRN
ncbi:MAG: hypothetical protein JSY10_29465 [Paenibacillus sp.]|nr:hypothetical protein [Paenibacillus sp.]